MKILVTVKRVEDPEIKIKIKPDGSGIVTDQMKYVVNPFDEIAVEEALRLRDAVTGEVVVASVGVADAAFQIRTALAMGADRGVHVLCEQPIDAMVTAEALAKIVAAEKPDLVILGKLAVDDELAQVGVILAEKLGWAQATCASKEESLESEDEKAKKPAFKADGGKLTLTREVDGGIETLQLTLPAVVTTELRLNKPRYTSAPGIMKAKKKPLEQKKLSELVADATPKLKVLKMEAPSSRKAGVIVADVPTLVNKLRTEAKAL